MNPRLPSSKKWTAFPADFIEQISQVFRDEFKAHLSKSKIIVEGRIYPEEVLLRVGCLEMGRLKQNNFEISMSYSYEKQDAVDRIHDCIDAAASMMSEFFESAGEVEFPVAWKKFDLDKNKSVYLQYSTVNTDLEAQADAILGLENKALVKEETNNDDPDTVH